MSDIISALKRLERAGSEHSKANLKLQQATVEVASTVARMVKGAGLCGEELPGGTRCDYDNDPHKVSLTLAHGGYSEDLTLAPSREACLAFAAALASGWLDQVAEALEKRTDQAEAARENVEVAAADLAATERRGMSLCYLCALDMATADTCLTRRLTRDGKTVEAVRWAGPDRCPDCNVAPGGYHHQRCDQERCPFCGEQMLSCRSGVPPEGTIDWMRAVVTIEAQPCADQNPSIVM